MRKLKKFINASPVLGTHRRAGIASVTLPFLSSSFTELKLFGKSTVGENQIRGVGDFDTRTGSYSIPISFETTNGESSEARDVLISSPLLRLGTAFDILDLVSGTVMRKVKIFTINEKVIARDTGSSGKFLIVLDRAARVGSQLMITDEHENEKSRSLSVSEDGAGIIIDTFGEVVSLRSLFDYLESFPLTVYYIAKVREEEHFSFSLPSISEEVTLKVLSTVPPSQTVAEFI